MIVISVSYNEPDTETYRGVFVQLGKPGQSDEVSAVKFYTGDFAADLKDAKEFASQKDSTVLESNTIQNFMMDMEE